MEGFMGRKAVILSLAFALVIAASPLLAHAETLSWNAVTTYTDGSAITAPVTYTAVWSTSSTLASTTTLASSISTLSTTFNVTTAAMPRGSTIYFGVRATVGGVNSAYSAPLSWLVPTIAPSSPGNLRVQ
jgi:hypothetical protein